MTGSRSNTGQRTIKRPWDTPTPGLKSNHGVGVPSVKGVHVGEDEVPGA